jgi:hypothetical protein
MRIRTTTRPGASPHPISTTRATNNTMRSGHEWAPSPPARILRSDAAHLSASELLPDGTAALVPDGLAAIPRSRGADPLQHATADGEVSA